MGIIDEILEEKRREVSELKKLHGESLFSLRRNSNSFYKSLKQEEYLSVIAEIKPKSPSHGVMASEENMIEIAKLYKKRGVNAISVLTDSKFFGGGYNLLDEISKEVDIALLAKDFIIDKIQIDMAVINGASAVLLISDILNDNELLKLYEYAISKKIDVLLEAHRVENVKRCVELNPAIIGINNRDLFTLKEDLNHSLRVREFLPDGAIKLSLSSIKSREDAKKVMEAGYDGILIGSVIMKAFNRSAALNSFMKIEKKMGVL
ncbi:MAG: indole-3-glycerol phosphate synthase TrpC [Brevinematia bacterium]